MWGAVRKTPFLKDLPSEVGVISAIAFSVALGFGIAAPALPLYARYFGVSALLASAVISVFALMRLLTSPVAGWAIEKLGERRILTWGLLIVASSSALAGLSQNYPQLLLMRSLGGIGSAMFTVSAMALLLRVVSANQRGRAAGAFQAGFLLGGVAGPAVGGAVIGISIRAPFFVYAVTLAVAAVVAWRYLPRHVAREIGEVSVSEPTDPPPTLAQALRQSPFRAALAANLTQGFVTFGLRMSLVPLFVVEGLKEPASMAGIAFLIAAASQVLVLVPGSRMSDQRGRRPAMMVGTLTTAIGMVVLALAGAAPVFLLSMAILGAGAAFMGSAPAATAGDVVGSGGKGTVIAAFQMTADFGAILGPLAAGLLADSLGYQWAFATGAAVSAVAFGMAVVMSETLKKTSEPA